MGSGGVSSRENDGGNVLVAEFVVLELGRTKEAVGKPSSGSDGDGGQEPLAGDVSDGSDTGNIRGLVLVDDNVALGGSLDTKSLQTEALGVGLTTDCPQDNVGLDLFPLIGVDGQISWLTLDLGDLCLSVEFDAGVLHPRSENLLDGRVESSEDGVTTDEEMGLGSEGVEDTCEFDSDVASADDDNSFRLVFEVEEAIRGDTEASSGNFLVRGDGGMTTGGDANVIGLDGVRFLTRLRDLDLGGGNDGSVAVEKIDTLPVPVGLVDTTESLDVSVALKLEGGPVELWLAETLEFVSYGMTKLISEIGGMPHQLLWDAS